jgi:hypothetical protein
MHSLVEKLNINIKMHGEHNVKLINAQQAKPIYHDQNSGFVG